MSLGAFTRAYDVVTSTFIRQTVVVAVVVLAVAVAGGGIAATMLRRRDFAPAEWA